VVWIVGLNPSEEHPVIYIEAHLYRGAGSISACGVPACVSVTHGVRRIPSASAFRLRSSSSRRKLEFQDTAATFTYHAGLRE
jgi:hypothetical protein